MQNCQRAGSCQGGDKEICSRDGEIIATCPNVTRRAEREGKTNNGVATVS